MPTKRKTKRAVKRPAARLAPLTDEEMTDEQKAVRDAVVASRKSEIRGPFLVYLHAPKFGDHAQRLGAHCRYHTVLPPRLSEFAILVTARLWKAQYEWFAHAKIAATAGVTAKTIADLRAGRAPNSAPKDERMLYDFIMELYKTKRVSKRNYDRVFAILGKVGTIELVGILGYYAMVAMTLNAFTMPIPEGEEMPFAEPKVA
jgi:4-carboxymuconolactone decarboxylase